MLPVAGRLRIGADDDLVRLNDAAWAVLERTGFKVYSQRLLEKLRAFGAQIDLNTMVAKFPRELLTERLGCELRPEPPEQPIQVGSEFHVGFGEVCFFLYDRETGQRRSATRQWKELLAGWEQPDVNTDLIAEVHEVVERAKREIAR